jgi:pimeloyl-ACP methyl ester carboxylesterase
VPNAEPNSDPLETAKRSERKMRQLGDWDWHEEFARLEVPTLVLAGSEDVIPLESTRDWAETLPRAELLVLENCGHLPWLETPERFNPAVAAFLDAAR